MVLCAGSTFLEGSLSRWLVLLGVTATPSTSSWSNHHFLTGLRFPFPTRSSSQVAIGTSSGFSHKALMPIQLAERVSSPPSASTTLLIGHIFMQRPHAEPLGWGTR